MTLGILTLIVLYLIITILVAVDFIKRRGVSQSSDFMTVLGAFWGLVTAIVVLAITIRILFTIPWSYKLF